MQTITTAVFFPAVERALAAVGGRSDPQVCEDSAVPVEQWATFLRQLQGELGPEWGPIEEQSGNFATPHVSIPYAGSEVSRRRLPIIFRHGLAMVEGTQMLRLRFNPRTL